jgi:hypothetical protein
MSRNGQQQRKIRAKVVKKKLERQQAKERGKVARHLLNLQQLGEADKNPAIIELRNQIEADRRGLNNLIQAHNKNFRAYTDAFQHLDARLGALMLVSNDIVELLHVRGLLDESVLTTTLVRSTDASSGKEIERSQPDWEAYIAYYLKTIRDTKEAAAGAEQLVESIAEESDDDYADTTFGGEDPPNVEASSGGAEISPG